jgi:hypothetical protein
MSAKRSTVLVAWIGLALCVVVFPRLASVVANNVPFAHLVFAPFGSTLISTAVFAMVVGWLLLSRLSPAVVDRPARSFAHAVGLVIGLVWIAYAGFWLLLYSRGGL